MTTEELNNDAPAEGRDFDWQDDEEDVVVAQQMPVAVYRNPAGEVVLRQANWPDEDALIVFAAEHGRAVAAAVLRCAGLGEEAPASETGNGGGAGSRGKDKTGAERQRRYRARKKGQRDGDDRDGELTLLRPSAV